MEVWISARLQISISDVNSSIKGTETYRTVKTQMCGFGMFPARCFNIALLAASDFQERWKATAKGSCIFLQSLNQNLQTNNGIITIIYQQLKFFGKRVKKKKDQMDKGRPHPKSLFLKTQFVTFTMRSSKLHWQQQFKGSPCTWWEETGHSIAPSELNLVWHLTLCKNADTVAILIKMLKITIPLLFVV